MAIKNINRILRIHIASIKNIFDVINNTATAIIIGKLRKIKKLNITLILRTNIKKYNFIVFFIFNSAIFDDNQIDSNIHLFPTTISYFEYTNNTFKIVLKTNIIKYQYEILSIYSIHRNLKVKR